MRALILFATVCTVFMACSVESTNSDKSKVESNTNVDYRSTEVIDKVEKHNFSLEKIWETDTIFDTPESVLSYGDVLYVSNVGGVNPLTEDGNGFISKLTESGEVISLKWLEGLNGPKGMSVLGNKLYVTDINRLIEVDLEKGKVINFYPVDSAIFLNDVTVNNGVVYFSDMKTNKIHAFSNGEVSLFADKLEGVNGLYAEDKELLCLNSTGFQSIDYKSKEVKTVSGNVKGGDGLEKTNSGDYVASKWKGEIYLVKGSEAHLLLDTKKDNTQTADIGYIKSSNSVVVPTFFGNTIVSYKLID